MLRDLVLFWAGIVVGTGITGCMAILILDRMHRDNQRPTVGRLRGEAD